MLSKCANPNCSANFLYLHEGKLFRSESASANGIAAHDTGMKKSSRRIEFFWLCANCAPRMTLIRNGEGITVRPMSQAQAAGL
jgi:hypothetical protein